jgi:hypothetical protein
MLYNVVPTSFQLDFLHTADDQKIAASVLDRASEFALLPISRRSRDKNKQVWTHFCVAIVL